MVVGLRRRRVPWDLENVMIMISQSQGSVMSLTEPSRIVGSK